jgi:hypothetical protein
MGRLTSARLSARSVRLIGESSSQQENIKLGSRTSFPDGCILFHIGRDHRDRCELPQLKGPDFFANCTT